MMPRAISGKAMPSHSASAKMALARAAQALASSCLHASPPRAGLRPGGRGTCRPGWQRPRLSASLLNEVVLDVLDGLEGRARQEGDQR
eukprot:7433607-Pyramimonas_sp.AAC.1